MIVSVSRAGRCALNNNWKSYKAATGGTFAVLKHVKPISDKTAFWRGLLNNLPAKVPDTSGKCGLSLKAGLLVSPASLTPPKKQTNPHFTCFSGSIATFSPCYSQSLSGNCIFPVVLPVKLHRDVLLYFCVVRAGRLIIQSGWESGDVCSPTRYILMFLGYLSFKKAFKICG